MLPGGLDLMYRQALAAGHEPYIKIEIWTGTTTKVIDNLVISDGSISASLQSRVSRTCSFTCHEDLYDTINPYGQRIRAFRGVQFADGSNYSWQVFAGRVTGVSLTDDGRCQVVGSDNAYDVISNQFTTPRNSDVGLYVNDEVKRIIDERFTTATFGTSDTFLITVPQLTWESDPGQALDEMATSVGAFWYALANGDFVLRKYPWTVPGNPVLTFSDGDSGSVIAAHAVRNRTNIYNQIVVTAERVDGSPATFAVAQDRNPASSTYVLGPFGIQSKTVTLQTPTTQDGAQDAANAYLRRTTAFTEVWGFSCVPDAALELGDIIGLNVRDREGIIQVVSAFTIPMTVTGNMSVTCRAQVIGTLDS